VIAPERTARIIEWNNEKGYGFLQNDGSRLFLHIRDFAQRDRLPRPGDLIRFRVGYDRDGRSCAVNAMHEEKLPGGELTLSIGIKVGLLLFLPTVAVVRFAPDLRYVAAYVVVVSVLTWFAYAHDKNRAQTRGWRVAESQLHLLELLGGWPAAFLAQRFLRHKTLKSSYRFTFWLIVLSHQYIALDSLLRWKITSTIAHWFK
jgi:uncharacterized membrane protein YsdA (DUF1294 family)/cold shock CspA family protein